jgi:uncharacterized protein (TIGR02391 family)
MDYLEEKKIKLLLKDFLMNHSEYQNGSVYLDIYDDYNEIFQKVFSYFHERMNELFEFMNNKSVINNHYNADDSRELIKVIKELSEIKRVLRNTNYDFEINNSYVEQIKYVQNFLKSSGGSLMPDDYKKFDIVKYEPIFNLKNKSVSFKNFDSSVSMQANFNIDAITIKINENILKHIKTLLETEHYFNAVEESYKIVREKLKSITGRERAHEAFKDNNKILIFGHEARDEAENNFFEGVKFLHMAIQNLRNEKAHMSAIKIDKNLAIHYIVLASLAYDLISDN